jgi:hypothetical protein
VKIRSLFILFFSLNGCAYHFGPHQRQLPGGAKTIFVKMFENRTREEVGIESDFTDAFTRELARTGVASVKNESDADIVLQGIVHTADYLGKTSTGMPDVANNPSAALFTEYQARITIVLRAVDRHDKEVWQGQFLGEKNYKASQVTIPGLRTANPLYNQSARRQVVRLVAKDLAAEAVGRMTENF